MKNDNIPCLKEPGKGLHSEFHENDKLTSIVTNWLAIYPSITLLLFLLESSINHLPLAIKTLIVTVLIVPFMVMIAVPVAKKIWNVFSMGLRNQTVGRKMSTIQNRNRRNKSGTRRNH